MLYTFRRDRRYIFEQFPEQQNPIVLNMNVEPAAHFPGWGVQNQRAFASSNLRILGTALMASESSTIGISSVPK
jgi:hypothetical protein